MALPRSGSRPITIDGKSYRWTAVYEKVTWCSAPCPVRLVVQSSDGEGQLLVAEFNGVQKDEQGRDWVFPRYGSELTPAKTAEIIRAGLAAGWKPDAAGPAFTFDGEPFLRLPPDPTVPPPGSEDDLKRKLLAAIRTHLAAEFPPESECTNSAVVADASARDDCRTGDAW